MLVAIVVEIKIVIHSINGFVHQSKIGTNQAMGVEAGGLATNIAFEYGPSSITAAVAVATTVVTDKVSTNGVGKHVGTTRSAFRAFRVSTGMSIVVVIGPC